MKKNKPQRFLQYTLTGDMYKADLPAHAPKELVDTIKEAYRKVRANDKSVIVKLLHWIEKYPDIPQFKNYLCLYYSLNGDHKKANEINNELLKQFPDYLYAKLNFAKFYIANNEPDKIPEVLGKSLELRDLYPDRKIYHHDEYIDYYETVVEYYCKINQPEKAEDALDDLYEVADLFHIETDFKQLESLIFLSHIENIDFGRFNRNGKVITEREKPTLPQTKMPPAFHYPQITWLYQHELADMPPEKINELLSLEKEWLRIDLETAVYDAIRRYNFFKKKEFNNNNELDFCLHALYLLKEIKAEESLPVILEILRQPYDLLHFWFSDMLTDNIWQVIYTLGFNQTSKLAEFLKEPLNYEFARTEVSVALKQIVLHHSERRKEIIGLYKDVIDFFISNKTDKTVVDNTLIDLMIDDIVEINGKELLPEIKILFDEEMTDEYLTNRLEEITEEFDEIPEGEYDEDFKKDLQNYFEIAAEIASWQKKDKHDDEEDEDDTDEYCDDWEEVKAEEDNTQYFYSGDKPFVRTAPKVGRNQPCPCGSGKKYKNCHGIND